LEAPVKAVSTRSLSALEISAIEEGVRNGLKDPESARFKHPFADSYAIGESYYCGYVNAKNSYGGYTGDQPFAAMPLEKSGEVVGAALIGAGNRDRSVIYLLCKEHGYEF
jgi:hypothetical protein